MSIDGICVCSSGNFIKSSSYINKTGEHPSYLSAILWNRLVFKEEELCDNNWLYIGSDSEEDKKNQMQILKMHKGWIPILE
jgi:hypothetical protein